MTCTTELPARSPESAPRSPVIREVAARRHRAEARRTHLSLGDSRTARDLTFAGLTLLALLWLLPAGWWLLTAFKSEQDALPLWISTAS
ncbi:hypothetical protein [Streptomyces canus]|uniref:hypothetical protein n=1 Tax=Streptomyces canus TaxID=58343 RepID=UPI003F53F7F4